MTLKLLVQGAASFDEVPGLDAAAGDTDIRFAPDEDSLAKALPDADVLLGWNFRGRALENCWELADRLRWIHWCGAGVNALLFPKLVESDVAVTNARGIFDRAMSETVLGYMLVEAKGLRKSWDLQRQRQWEHRLSDRLRGQRALVVGVGSIGHEVGDLLRAVGVEVRGIGRSQRAADPVFGQVHTLADLPSLAREADWVIGVLPSTAETRGVFNHELFAAMSPGARFINVGRGDAQDEDALRDALEKELIAGAMLDVFQEEPLPAESPLWDTPNLVITPHNSGDYRGFEADLVTLFLDNLARYRTGEPLANRVDKQRGYSAPD